MDNTPNKGIGDYAIITILGAIAGFHKYGFDWFGFKAVLYCNGAVILYAILVYLVAKFK